MVLGEGKTPSAEALRTGHMLQMHVESSSMCKQQQLSQGAETFSAALDTLLLVVAGMGELSVRKVRHALNKFSEEIVPLTMYQIHTIMSVAPLDKLGSVKYTHMVPIVANTVKAITDLQSMKQRFYVIQQLSESQLLKQLADTDPSTFRQQLREAFEHADQDGTGTLTGESHFSHFPFPNVVFMPVNCSQGWMVSCFYRQTSIKCPSGVSGLSRQQLEIGSSSLAEHACSCRYR